LPALTVVATDRVGRETAVNVISTTLVSGFMDGTDLFFFVVSTLVLLLVLAGIVISLV
jgi:hypothetical protein